MVRGTVLVSIGATSGASVSFGVCRYFFYHWMKDKLSKYPKWDIFMREVESNAWKLTLLIRLLPFPFGLVNGLFALSTISFHIYLVGSFLGLLPFQVMWTYFGTTLRSITEAVEGDVEFTIWQQLLLGVQVVAGIVMILYFVRLGRHALAPMDIENSGDAITRSEGSDERNRAREMDDKKLSLSFENNNSDTNGEVQIHGLKKARSANDLSLLERGREKWV